MSVAVETGVSCRVVTCATTATAGRLNRLRNNHRDNEAVNAQHARHDNGHNVLDDAGRMVNAHVADAEAGPPRPPRAAPARQHHAAGGAHVAAVFE